MQILLASGQDQSKKETSFGPGLSFYPLGNYSTFQLARDESDPTWSSKSFYSFGIAAIFKTRKMIEFETGIYYSYHLMSIDHPEYYYHNYYPDQKIELIEFPLNIRLDFPYFFVSTGLLADIELSNSNFIDNQGGIGFNTGFGLSYKFKSGILIYAGPVFFMHNFFPSHGQQLTGMTLKIGIAFN